MIQYQFIGQRVDTISGTMSAETVLSPVYNDKTAFKYVMENNSRFYTPSWDGSLKFKGADYGWVIDDIEDANRYQVRYEVTVRWMDVKEQTWHDLCTLQFMFTDCEVNADDGIITVKPSVKTPYKDVNDGLDREFNLVKLNPVIEHLQWDKRGIIQVTTAASNYVTNCIGYNTWEVEKSNTDGNLIDDYKFAVSDRFQIAEIISGNGVGTYYGRTPAPSMDLKDYELPRGVWSPTSVYRYKLRLYETMVAGLKTYHVELYQGDLLSPSSPYTLVASNMDFGSIPSTLTNYNLYNANSQLYCTLNLRSETVYARLLCDVSVAGSTVARPTEDIVPYSNNYRYVAPYSSNIAVITNGRQSEPNEYGQFPYSAFPGYYTSPAPTGYLPILQDDWTNTGISMWVSLALMPDDTAYRKNMTLRHAYPLYSCIKVILQQIAPDVHFGATTDFSEFLFSNTNPLTGDDKLNIFITPKSNIIAGDYQTPAYNAPIRLQEIFDMLRKVYKLYWFIDAENNLRIEHISWFMNGGMYGGAQHVISHNLTTMLNTRNGKPWSFAKNAYSFGKTEMPATYTFNWMDDVSDIFNGYQMNLLSPLVDRSKNEEVQVSKFTSDIDFVTISPDDISKDGFMLLGAYQEPIKGYYYVPYLNYQPMGASETTALQNGYLAFAYLEKSRIILADIPESSIDYADGDSGDTWMQSRNKEQKSVIIPLAAPVIDPVQLIRTGIGDGEIKEITINLSSLTATATLRYDTVQ